MAGTTRPVRGGAYSGPRSEPGGQNTPRAGRSVASLGASGIAVGWFSQQVDQGLIFDDAADATAIVTADGSGVESYSVDDFASGTTTAGGSGIEARVYDDTGTLVSLVPTAVAVVDSFNRADGGVLAGAGAAIWSPTVFADTLTPSLAVSANRLEMIGTAESALTLADYSGDFDMIFDVPIVPSSGSFRMLAMCTRATTPAAATGYGMLIASSSNLWTVQRNDGAGFAGISDLAFTKPTIALQNGDRIALSRRGNRLSGFLGHAGVWTLMAISNADITYPSGAFGIQAVNTPNGGWWVDNFVGGSPSNVLVSINGTGVESQVYTDSRTCTVTATGTGYETITPYDAVLDEDNPVSHWKLGDPSTAVDRKGLRSLPAASGPIATATGLVANNGTGTANEFVGTTSQRFTESDATGFGLPYQGPYTMEAWFTPTVDADGAVMTRTPGTGIRVVNTGTGNVEVTHAYENSVNDQQTTPSTSRTIPIGVPAHLVATHDGSTVLLYINGVERARVTAVNGTRSAPNTTPKVGGSRAAAWLRGVVDEVAWYNTALAPERVLAHYQAGVATAYDAVVDADSPVSHWKLGWSTTKAVDRARRKLNLDAQNPPIAISDKGVVYQGDNDRANTFVTGSSQRLLNLASGVVGTDGTLYNTTNLSAEAWIKPSAVAVGGSYGIVRRPASTLALYLNAAKPAFEFNDPSASTKRATSPTPVVANAACHLVGTYDGATLILYVNGVEKARLATATGIALDPTSLPQIGYTGGSYWDGDIDEVAWYDTALTPGRVQAHFLAGLAGYATLNGTGVEVYVPPVVFNDSGTATVIASGTGVESYSAAVIAGDVYAVEVLADNPALWWRMDEAAGQIVVHDSSGHGRDGSVWGGVSYGTFGNPGLLVATPGGGSYHNNGGQLPADTYQPFQLGSVRTFEGWFNVDEPGAPYDQLFGGDQYNATAGMGLYAGTPARVAWHSGPTGDVTWPSAFTRTVVQHMVLVYDDSSRQAELFINGVSQGAVTSPGGYDPSFATQHLQVAKTGLGGGYALNGRVDEFAVYEYALSPARILAHYVAGNNLIYTDSGSGTIIALGSGIDVYVAQRLLIATVV